MNAWRDYLQMGESTGQLTVDMFCSCIAHNPDREESCKCFLQCRCVNRKLSKLKG